MSDEYRILMLGGAKRVSIARMFQQAASQLGAEAEIFSYELSKTVPIAACGEVIIGKRFNDPEILEHLHQTVTRYGINIIIPFVDPAVSVAAAYRDAFPGAVFVPVGDKSKAEDMFDKCICASLFEAAGIPIPATYHGGDITMPLIAKPRNGSASKGIEMIDTADDLAHLPMPIDSYLIQERIDDREEISVDCYVSTIDGEVLAAVTRRRLEVIGGEASRTVTFHDAETERLAIRTLQTLGLRGAVTIQMIRDKHDGRLMLMEINPRLGGGAVCAVHAGADIPKMILQEASGQRPQPASWDADVEITRYMQEVTFRKGILVNDENN